MLPSFCVVTLRGCTARPASRSRWCRPTILRPAPGRTACPRRLGEPAFQRSNSTIRTHARRTMCRSAADVLSTSPKSPIASASDRDIDRGRHTRSTGGSTRRRRGRENSPSRPTIWGMTVVDRPTISEQFFGRFHAHSFPKQAVATVLEAIHEEDFLDIKESPYEPSHRQSSRHV